MSVVAHMINAFE